MQDVGSLCKCVQNLLITSLREEYSLAQHRWYVQYMWKLRSTSCKLHTKSLTGLLPCMSGRSMFRVVAVRTVPPDQVRLIGSTGLDSGLVLVERSVKEWVGVLRDSVCGLL